MSSGGRTPRDHGATVVCTAVAMFAFAANSLLCRLALAGDRIDAATFTAVRVVAGALVLGVLALPGWRKTGRPAPRWGMVLALSGYMVCFSFAYRSLTAGTGALVLFGAVQLTMFVVALRAGERFHAASWLGFAVALGGLVWLVLPGVTAPDATGAVLMAAAGVAWGLYSLLGRAAGAPLLTTAANFLFAAPLALAANVACIGSMHVTSGGVLLAAASGALASGLGYFVWYRALERLPALRAATVQLSVPVLAAAGGVALLGEPVTTRLVVAAAATLGGIALVLAQRR